ncbi:MAG TPA: DCC1-like thiol-disulfide oxidoreductase family protein [Verrucomicrobiae bacterium]|nr:DCC1-like thiol-disulfide oxidoreductase family protein [Verrucomicrobiae bacterium]
MNTEITDIKEFKGWVLYDAECRFCTGMVGRWRRWLAARHLEVLPLQTPWVRERLALPEAKLLAEVKLLQADGAVFGGAEAVMEICRQHWLTRPVYWLGKIPVLAKILHAGYRWVARNRHCVGGACAVGSSLPGAVADELALVCHDGAHGVTRPTLALVGKIRNDADRTVVKKHTFRLIDFLPLLILPVMAFCIRAQMAAWVFMWAMAVALYAGCKWLTYRVAKGRGIAGGGQRIAGYLLAWPGMDANEFLEVKNIPERPHVGEWVLGLAKLGFGLVILYVIARRALPIHPLLAGWVGMVGIVFVLHFGLFHIVSLLWRRAGVKAMPMMRNPLVATAVTEFWGVRWNTAFNQLAFDLAYRPLRRLGTAVTATLLVFVISGLIHELVISVPARAGYGLPTAYFLIQGLGVVFERTIIGRKLGLGRGVCGWLFTVLITAAPAFWLFHPPFIHNVILPMLTAIGAT